MNIEDFYSPEKRALLKHFVEESEGDINEMLFLMTVLFHELNELESKPFNQLTEITSWKSPEKLSMVHNLLCIGHALNYCLTREDDEE